MSPKDNLKAILEAIERVSRPFQGSKIQLNSLTQGFRWRSPLGYLVQRPFRAGTHRRDYFAWLESMNDSGKSAQRALTLKSVIASPKFFLTKEEQIWGEAISGMRKS